MTTFFRTLGVLSLVGTFSSCGESISPENILPPEKCLFSLSGREFSCPVLDDIVVEGEVVSFTSYSLFLRFTSDSTVSAGYSFVSSSGEGATVEGIIDALVPGKWASSGQEIIFEGLTVPSIKPLRRFMENDEYEFTEEDVFIIRGGTLKSGSPETMECSISFPSLLPQLGYLTKDFRENGQ